MAPELFFGIGALILGLAIAWGMIQYRNRDKSKDRLTDQATHQIYNEQEKGPAARMEPPRSARR